MMKISFSLTNKIIRKMMTYKIINLIEGLLMIIDTKIKKKKKNLLNLINGFKKKRRNIYNLNKFKKFLYFLNLF